jgi:hypothetical protein
MKDGYGNQDPQVQIDYSGCCFNKTVWFLGVYYQGNPSSISINSLNKNNSIDTRSYRGKG